MADIPQMFISSCIHSYQAKTTFALINPSFSCGTCWQLGMALLLCLPISILVLKEGNCWEFCEFFSKPTCYWMSSKTWFANSKNKKYIKVFFCYVDSLHYMLRDMSVPLDKPALASIVFIVCWTCNGWKIVCYVEQYVLCMYVCNVCMYVCIVSGIKCTDKKIHHCFFFQSFAESKGAVVKVKRQAWTATAITAFFEGLCEVCSVLVYTCTCIVLIFLCINFYLFGGKI